LFFQQLRRVKPQVNIGKKKNRLVGIRMGQHVKDDLRRVRRSAAIVALGLYIQVGVDVTDDDSIDVLPLPGADFLGVGMGGEGAKRAEVRRQDALMRLFS
jgi:hypothetical protein